MPWGLRHCGTGELIVFEQDPDSLSRYRLKLKCDALRSLAWEHDLVLYFFSLTRKDAELVALNSDLNGLVSFLRWRFKRAGYPLYYVWAAELQMKRYYRTGQKGLHWHFIIACPFGALPDVVFVQDAPRGKKYQIVRDGDLVKNAELFKRWSYGQILCGRAKVTNPFTYLREYLEKDYGGFRGYRPEWANLRRWGSSQMGWRGYPKWAREGVQAVLDWSPDFKDLKVRKKGGKVQFVEKRDLIRADGHPFQSERVVYDIESPWRREFVFDQGGENVSEKRSEKGV